MKNITVSVDEETYRLSRVRAARLGISVYTLVRGCLKALVRQGPDGTEAADKLEASGRDRRRRLLNDVLANFDARGVGLHMTDNLSRDALYDRDALR